MNSPVPATPVRTGSTPLDEVMLAMDIVDTLRHERSTVERELETEARDEALVARIRQVYANQGIEVTDDLVRQGVEALKQDRFVYVPPKPSFALRLAHAYVARWRWFKGALLVAVLASAGWVAWQLPQQWRDSRAYAAYSERIDDLQARADGLDTRVAQLARWHEARGDAAPVVRAPVDRLVDEVRVLVDRSRNRLATAVLVEKIAADPYPAQAAAASAAIDQRAVILDEVDRALDVAGQKSAQVDALDALADRYGAATTAIAGATLDADARVATEAARQRAESALRAGDSGLAEPLVRRLAQTAVQLALAYELRIVSAPGVRSGVWRYPVDNPKGRNYYLVVEAIGDDGAALSVPISNEETGTIETVSRYAVRVPEAVYEAVKADKLDNGLIDDGLVGIKRRGALDVEFRKPVAGGYITRWED